MTSTGSACEFLTEVLGVELFEGGAAGFIGSVAAQFGGGGAAELDGFGEEGVGLEVASGCWVGKRLDFAGASQIELNELPEMIDEIKAIPAKKQPPPLPAEPGWRRSCFQSVGQPRNVVED